MQSYVARKFGSLVDEHGVKICVPLMDDLTVSSPTFEKHVQDVNQVLGAAAQDGFEFKLTKGQFNQEVVVIWGCVCDRHGKRPQEKQIEQLSKWPFPQTESDVVSFLAFVNYLRKWMHPDWLLHETTLRPFRKKGVKFREEWNGPKHEEYKAAWVAIRDNLNKNAILYHPNFEAASRPEESGCPFEIFVDASDYGWAAVLTQREVPHGPPRIIDIIAKGFSDVQLRWSAMERESSTPCGKEWLGSRNSSRDFKHMYMWTTRTICFQQHFSIIEESSRRSQTGQLSCSITTCSGYGFGEERTSSRMRPAGRQRSSW